MAEPEARFEGGKEKTEMLWCHMGYLCTDTDYSFSWVLIYKPFWIIIIPSVQE